MSNILRSNELLLVNETIESANGSHMLILQGDGNLVLYEKVRHEDGSIVLDPAWASRTIGQDTWYGIMQDNGDFVLCDREGVTLWHTDTGGNPGSFLQLDDDGNLVINGISRAWTAGIDDDGDEDGEELDEALAEDMMASSASSDLEA